MRIRFEKRGTDKQRRRFLLGAAAFLLQACGGGGGESPVPMESNNAAGMDSGSPPAESTKPKTLNLADYGGVPGADPLVLKDAFIKAYEQLRLQGGGELLVSPGIYDFGNYSEGANIIFVDGLSNVLISAYGATFRLNTTANVVPCLFYFSNPNNVTVAGASFNDLGFDPEVDWRGMYCVKAEATRPCGGFRMIDCNVNGAVGLFQSQQFGANKFLIKDVSLHGTVENAYYGAGLSYVGDNAGIDFICQNVRRGCVTFGLKNANIRIKMSHSVGAPASNGFIVLACEGEIQGNVENVRIDLDASGVAGHAGLIHFYHQQSEAFGYMRNVDAAVTVNKLEPGDTAANLFLFDHELPDTSILRSTSRGWDQIFLHGSVTSVFPGRIIHSPSVSTSAGVIYVDPGLISQAALSELPGYFRFKSS